MKRQKAALIDEARCIGCTRCIEVCPVDAIVGAQGVMHTVVEAWCIGCDLCPPACPVDCIDLVAPRGAWTGPLKAAAGKRGILRRERLKGAQVPPVMSSAERKKLLADILSRKRA